MSYSKQTWANGDVITADRLNYMEDGIKSTENGYETVEKTVTYYDGNLTTADIEDVYVTSFPNGIKLNDNIIIVTFEGIEYEVEKKVPPKTWFGDYVYGDASNSGESIFTRYPFCIYVNSAGTALHTETAGTYAIKVEGLQNDIEIAEEFEDAVKKITNNPRFIVELTNNNNVWSANKTFSEISEAWEAGREVIATRYAGMGNEYIPLSNINPNISATFTSISIENSQIAITSYYISAWDQEVKRYQMASV